MAAWILSLAGGGTLDRQRGDLRMMHPGSSKEVSNGTRDTADVISREERREARVR